ncbi:C2 family cysteine protease [Nocardiopsis potens]|uniref:C2 family cysteine protease n=1 Tax=Nocardiopsis potens TaxID=1246458 RepID=UPI000346C201|nr:C2 family cysteine protease [Nocardiopsis potens]
MRALSPPPAAAARRRPDRGAGLTEYAAGVLVVAALVVAVFATGLDSRIADMFREGLCRVSEAVEQSGACEENDGPDTRGPDVTTQEHRIGGGGNGKKPDGSDGPDYADPEAIEDELAEIRESLDSGFWDFCLFNCPRDPAEVMEGMTSEELNTLMSSLTADEIRELLDSDGVREIVLSRVDLEILRDLRDIDRHGIDPSFDDVEGDSANTEDGRRTDLGWAEYPNGTLWGDDGEIGSDDLRQGALGDCWWLAGMGAIADQNPQIIKDMIKENANGTYTVTFGDGEQVTVTPDLVVNSNNSPAFSSPQGGVMWPAILEKAYAEKEGSFGEIEGGWPGDAMETITGDDSGEVPGMLQTEEFLSAMLDEGVAIGATTPGDKKDSYYELESGDSLVGNHAYVVKEIKDGKVTLYNPWGRQHATLTMEEFREKLDTVQTNEAE